MLLLDNYFPCYTIPVVLAAFVIEIMSYLLITKLPGIQYYIAGFSPPEE